MMKAYITDSKPVKYSESLKEFLVNGKMMRFPLPVYDCIELGNKVIIGFGGSYSLRKNFPKFEYWRSVFAFDFEGNMLWQVEPPFYIDKLTGEKKIYNNQEAIERGKHDKFNYEDSIDSFLIDRDTGKIVAWGRIGYELDPDTGKLLSIHTYER